MFIFCCRGSRWRPWSRRWAFVCVCVSLSRQGPRVPPFSTSKISLSLSLDCTACLVLDLRSGSQYLESILSRFSLISVHSQRFGCTMPRKLKLILILKRLSWNTIEWKRDWLSYCLLDIGCFVHNTQPNRLHLTIASTKSFWVREGRLIIFGQKYVGRGVLFCQSWVSSWWLETFAISRYL